MAAGGLKKTSSSPLCLSSVNHISRNCVDLDKSVEFYENVLGFKPIKRPGSFGFAGAWLYNYGMGVHLLQVEEDIELAIQNRNREINPRDDHISFQCEDIVQVENDLKERSIKCTRRVVEEGGIMVEQLFFHDPDGFMIEVCNCDKLPVEPLTSPACNSRRYPKPFKATTHTLASDSFTQHLQGDYRTSNEQYAMYV
ncbi:unnamed protein product [Sphagnum compactum]